MMAALPSAIRNRATSSDERRRSLAEKTAALDAPLSPKRTPSVAGEGGHETGDLDSEQAGRPSEPAADERTSTAASQVEPAADAVATAIVPGSESEDEMPTVVCAAAVGSDADELQPHEAPAGSAAGCKARAFDVWLASLPKPSEPELCKPVAPPRSSLLPPVPSVSDEDRLRIQQGRTPAGIAPSVVEEVLGPALKPESGPSKYVPLRELRGGSPVSTAAEAPLEPVTVGVDWRRLGAGVRHGGGRRHRYCGVQARQAFCGEGRQPPQREAPSCDHVCAQRATSYIGGKPHVVAKAMLWHRLGWAPSTRL